MKRESYLKNRIRTRLRAQGDYVFSPVHNGMGLSSVDILGCSKRKHGQFYGIEVKVIGNLPTARQEAVLQEIKNTGGAAFWCDSWDSFLLNAAAWGLIASE